MQDYQQRVIDEKNALSLKLKALLEFLQKGKPNYIDAKNWQLLSEQYDAMNWYYVILISRIELF